MMKEMRAFADDLCYEIPTLVCWIFPGLFLSIEKERYFYHDISFVGCIRHISNHRKRD